MSVLRLKTYARQFFEIFLGWHQQPPEEAEYLLAAKQIRSAYHTLASTILFLNQAQPEQELESWLSAAPLCYKLKAQECFALLKESSDWAVAALIPDGRSLEYKGHPVVDNDLIDRIRLDRIASRGDLLSSPTLSQDLFRRERLNTALSREFIRVCTLVHQKCQESNANNDQLFLALLRLAKAYQLAVECGEMSKDLAGCDRIDFLRRLTQ